jgi:hypothetical protein
VYTTYYVISLENETTLRGEILESRKRERNNEDGVFMSHQKGPITSTFTTDWFLREGEGRELLDWIHKITKKRNPTGVSYVRPSSYRKVGSIQRRISPSKTWFIFSYTSQEEIPSDHME